MHGVIFGELEKFACHALGPAGWEKLMGEAGLGRKVYDPLGDYPDAEVLALVGAACRLTGLDASAVLERFGAFIAPDLLQMFWGAIDPEWKTLDVIEHTERTVHSIVRIQHPGARPPQIEATRTRPDEVRIVYASPRKLCALAKGVAQGLAGHFGERIEITEPACMHRGAARCEIVITRRD